MPTFHYLRSKLETEFGCVFKSINDDPFPVDYFERAVNGKKLLCPVSFEDDSAILTPTVLRHICRRLNIDPAKFGLHLG